MSFKKPILILFILIIKCLPLLAQQDSIPLTTLVTKAEKFSAGYPFEKVYLHFDKPYYAVNDTIWFKAYLAIGPLHQPSGLSRIVYVDVTSDRDTIVQSLKLPVLNGVAFGDITLSRELYKQGNYHIRAYTNWMRNFDPDYFFNKTITIGDADNNRGTPKVSFTKTEKNNGLLISAKVTYKNLDGNPDADRRVSWTIQNGDEVIKTGKGLTDKNGLLPIYFQADKPADYNGSSLVTVIELGSKKSVTNTFSLASLFSATDVQFFPEGGELISGVRSKVAFKAVNPNGIGVDVNGSVVDNTGTEVASFTSAHAGMGIFALLPEEGKIYKAIVTFPDGSKNTFDLPAVRTDGINLAVNNSDPDNLGIKIATNDRFFKAYQNRGFYIIAQSGGTVYYTGLAALQSLVYTASIPKNKFPEGVLQVTLFAADGDPISERVLFIRHNDALNLTLNTDHPAYAAKQHAKITLTAKNNTVPVEGSFSVAVVDETKVPFDDDAETTILSSLLLTSDLRGYIEKPNYYFNHPDDKKLADLDVLMLTQGYRRFSYANIFENKYPVLKFLPENGMTVSGVLRTLAGVPVFKGNVSLTLPNKNAPLNAITDADGKFVFSDVYIADSSKVILSARNNSAANNLMITVDASSYQPVLKNRLDPYQINDIDSVLSAYLQNSKKQNESLHILKEVVIKGAKTKTVTHENYTSLNGLSAIADEVINEDRLKYCSFVLVQCIENVVFGLKKVDDNFYIQRDYDNGNKKPIKFFINGSPIDYNFLTTMDPANVQSIEFYKKDGFSNLNQLYNSNGVISITTKNGKFTPSDVHDNLPPLTAQSNEITLTPKGYYIARFFYSPKYDNLAGSAQQVTDLRTTIYWDPKLITDKNGNATFEFYNAGSKGTYRAIVEGIDNDGNIGRSVLKYQVK